MENEVHRVKVYFRNYKMRALQGHVLISFDFM